MSVEKPNQETKKISRQEQVKQAPNSGPSEKVEESFNGDPGIVGKAKGFLQRLGENKYKLLAGVFGVVSAVNFGFAGYKAISQGGNPLNVIPQGVENTQMTNAEMNQDLMWKTSVPEEMANNANKNTPNAANIVKDTRDGTPSPAKSYNGSTDIESFVKYNFQPRNDLE